MNATMQNTQKKNTEKMKIVDMTGERGYGLSMLFSSCLCYQLKPERKKRNDCQKSENRNVHHWKMEKKSQYIRIMKHHSASERPETGTKGSMANISAE